MTNPRVFALRGDSEKLSEQAHQRLDALLKSPAAVTDGADAHRDQRERTPFADLRADSGRVGLEAVLKAFTKLRRIDDRPV